MIFEIVDEDPSRERKLATKSGEEVLEDRDDEDDHRGEDQDHHLEHYRRVGHCRPDRPVEMRLVLDGAREAAQYLVEVPAHLAGLHERTEEM